jgi:rfaE bifunctional protein kinase chain/domain
MPDLSLLRPLQVLVVGDLMLDRYLSGRTDRISPEAPVPVVLLESDESRLGGAANVALNLKALGMRVALAGVVGTDAEGDLLTDSLRREGMNTKAILSLASRPTTVKTRILSRHQQLLRLDREVTAPLSEPERKSFAAALLACIAATEPDVLIFEDYNKGLIHPALIREVIAEALRRDIPVVVDPKEQYFFDYKHVTLFKPNLREVVASTGLAIDPREIEDLRRADAMLRQKLSHRYTIITLGEHGMYYSDGQQDALLPAHKKNIADVCGAGDTVVSVLAAALANQWPIADAAALANLAGAQVCEITGVAPVNAARLWSEWADYRR